MTAISLEAFGPFVAFWAAFSPSRPLAFHRLPGL